MTEERIIDNLKFMKEQLEQTGTVNDANMIPSIFNKTMIDVKRETLSEAITAIEEIQQYRAIGTVEECKKALVIKEKILDFIAEKDTAIQYTLEHKNKKHGKMVKEKAWKDFRNSGLLWWINMNLHVFGWAICYEIEKDGSISKVYPVRVKFRGFGEKNNTEGYMRVSNYMAKESKKLLEEAREE